MGLAEIILAVYERMKGMIKKVICSLVLLFLAFSLVGCKDKNLQSGEVSKEPSFAIFLINDLKSLEDIHGDINSLKIESQPLITDEDIVFLPCLSVKELLMLRDRLHVC